MPEHQIVALVAPFYRVDRSVKHKMDEEKQIQNTHAELLLSKIEQWQQQAPEVLPGSPLGKAISYTAGLWPGLGLT